MIDKKSFRKRAYKILCPLVGSPNDAVAIKYAAKMAQGEGVEVYLMNLVNPSANGNMEEVNELIAICTANSSMKVNREKMVF